jgi:hypothetical protein
VSHRAGMAESLTLMLMQARSGLGLERMSSAQWAEIPGLAAGRALRPRHLMPRQHSWEFW